MLWRGAALVSLAATAFIDAALGQVITITEYASVCSAVYTTGSRSVTVVQSTVTVQPQPWNDAAANDGAPFVVALQYGVVAAAFKRQAGQATTYLLANGNTTTDETMATRYQIFNGQLSSVNGLLLSTTYGILHQSFAVSSVTGAINTTFSIQNSVLSWTNSAFSGGAAQFFMVPNGNVEIIARFNGTIDSSWRSIAFLAIPAASMPSPFGYSSQATSVATNIIVSSMSAPPPYASASGSPPSPGSTTAPMPSTTGGVSTNGMCGSTHNGWVCAGSGFGDCCGSSGYCGNNALSCGAGCQTTYGSCTGSSSPPSYANQSTSRTSSSSVAASSEPISSMSLSVSMSMAGMTSSASSNSAASLSSSSTPLSTYTTPGQPIGPLHPIGYNVSMTTSSVGSTTESSMAGSTTASMGLPGYSTTVAATSSSATPSAPSTMASTMPSLSISAPAPTGYGSSSPVSTVSPSSHVATSSSSYTSSSSLAPVPSVYGSSSTASTVSSSSHASSSSSSPAAPLYGVSSTSSSSGSSSHSSSSISSSVTTHSASTSTLQSSTMTSSRASVAPTPSPAYRCPDYNDQTVPDGYGNRFIIACGNDTSAISYSSVDVADSFNECFNVCQNAPAPGGGTCTAFTYVGDPSGQGSGTCYVKSDSAETFTAGRTITIAAINVVYYAGPPIMAPVSSSTTSIASSTSSSRSSSSPAVTSITSSTASSSSHAITTTTSSVSSSSSAPAHTYLVLPSPTPCSFGDPSGYNEDDSYCDIALPFTMHMYSQQDTTSYASTNGFISIGYGSSQFQADVLPDVHIPNNTVAPFFDDLYLAGSSNPQQGIFYQFNAARTNVTYEYYLGRMGTNETYHFTVGYTTSTPGVFVYTYISTGNTTDQGIYASVGSQGFDATGRQVGTQYSLRTADINPGRVVTCDTTVNTCVTTNAGSASGYTGS